MSNVILARGGTPDFKGWFCEGQFSEFTPPYDAPHMPATPPFDSHADAAYGQGYLNLHFPLVPNLDGTYAHNWMQSALKGVKAVGDVIVTNWIPTRSFLNSLYIEVVNTDASLDGVYFKPVALRNVWNFTTEKYDMVPVTEFDDEITAAGITQLPLGTPAAGDKMYALARLSMDPTKLPSTFGHNLVERDATGKPIAGLDAAFGTVMLGLQITAGNADRIAAIWKSNIAVYLTSKLLAFEGAAQVG